jgi:TIR domain
MTPEKSRIVFISYSHKDSEFVNSFAAALLAYDLQIWKDSKDLAIGSNIPKSIYAGIKGASHFCCIISASSVKSAWVEEELSFAKVRQLNDSGLQIIPVLIDEVEIPDYVQAYLSAHLESRDVSIANPEFLRILKAFGTDLERYSREVITGSKRESLLKSCEKLHSDVAVLHEILGNFENAYIRYQEAVSNRGYDPPADGGFTRMESPYRRNPATTYGSDYRIDEARKSAVLVLTRLKADASVVQGSRKLVQQAWDDADPSRSVFRLFELLNDALDRVRYISETLSGASTESLNEWWMREKLSSWLDHLSVAQISMGSAITLLKSWASFDPAK